MNGDFDCVTKIGINYIKRGELEELRDNLKVYKLISNSFPILMDNGIIYDDIKNDGKIVYSNSLHINEQELLECAKHNGFTDYPSIAFTLDKESKLDIDTIIKSDISYRPRVISDQISYFVDDDNCIDMDSIKYILIPNLDVTVNRGIYEINNIIEVSQLLYLITRYERGSLDKNTVDTYLNDELVKKMYL